MLELERKTLQQLMERTKPRSERDNKLMKRNIEAANNIAKNLD
jgi:hypothetical protein